MLTCSYSFCYKVSGIVLSIKHLMARPLIGDQFPYICCSLFHKAFAASPAFDQIFIPDQETSNQKNDWVQTYGNDSTHLRSDHANILAVDYLSDGKTLDATFWLASNLENDSIYSQPLKRIRYGMLIAIVSLPSTSGYNGANYNFYIEAVDGRWSEYLYQLS
jgi:hypothetical protein